MKPSHALIPAPAAGFTFRPNAMRRFHAAVPTPDTRSSAWRFFLLLRHVWAVLLVLCLAPPAKGAESPVYGAFFGTHHLQAGGTLMPHPTGSAAWECWVRNVSADEVVTTTVWTPLAQDLGTYPGVQGPYVGITLPSAAFRDMILPPGTYHLVEELASGQARTNSLTLAAGTGPGAPIALGAESWTQWPAGRSLPVTWQPGPGTLPTDIFVVSLQEASGMQRFHETPMPGQSGALAATANSSLIPGSLLASNGTYHVKIACYRPQGGGGRLTGQYAATLNTLVVTGQGLADVARYQFVSGRLFQQDSTNAPVPQATNSYRAEALLRGVSAGWVTAARVQAPGQAVQPLTGDLDRLVWSHAGDFPSEATLAARWPGGTYRWTVEGQMGGTQEGNLAVTTGGWPAPLRILNLGNLQTNTFEEDSIISWVPMGPVSAVDRIELVVLDTAGQVVLQRPDPDFQAPIPGTTTQITLDSDDLPGGVELVGCLRYLQVDQRTTDTLGGAEAVAGRFAETRFPMGRSEPPLPAPLVILTTNLPPAAVARPYDAQLLAVGGTRPHGWTLSGGALPPGLTLGTNGSLHGLPRLAGTFALTARVTDATAQTFLQPLSLIVTGTIPELTIAVTNVPAVQGSWPYLAELASGGGVGPFTWEIASGQLPGGLQLMSHVGIIAGSPTQAGTFPFVVRLRDSSGLSHERNYTLTVPPPDARPLAIRRFELTNAAAGRLELEAEAHDSVSIEHSVDLVNWTLLLATEYPTNRPLEWTGLGLPDGFFRARWGRVPPAPNPANRVVPVLDTNLVAQAVLSPESQSSLSLTNTLGHVYRLDIPSNAAPYRVDMQMQYVRALGSSPFPNGYHGGVEFRPGGLSFRLPATLTVTFPAGVPPDYLPLAYAPGGVDPHLGLAVRQGNSLVLPILHFSGVGGASANAGEASQFAQDKNPCDTRFLGGQRVAEAAWRYFKETGEPAPAEVTAIPLKQWWDWSVWPAIQQAQTDESMLLFAKSEYGSWNLAVQLMGPSGSPDELLANPPGPGASEGQLAILSVARALQKAPPALARAYANAVVQTHVRAVTDNNPWIASRLFDYARDALILGLDEFLPQYLDAATIFERFERIWRFELQIESIIDVARHDGGHFTTQVRSLRCPFEYDGTNPSPRALVHGSRTNIHQMIWEYMFPTGERVRPMVQEGWLETVALWIDPVYEEETGASDPADCRRPKAPRLPVDARITTLFNVGDPVKTMLVQAKDGSWKPQPVGGSSWELLLQVMHAMNGEYGPLAGDPGVNLFQVSLTWQYVGGSPLARADYTDTRQVMSGTATERTLLELYFAPQPLRASDTRLPNP